MDHSEKVNELFSAQLREWDLAGTNYNLLSKVRTRKLNPGGFEVLVQFNPERIKSSAAKVDTKSIEGRPCFLCENNRPQQQRGVAFNNDLTILVNPFPIFNKHLTISSNHHIDQRIRNNMESMLLLAIALPDFIIFYNGPECGASAPDHFHFQAGSRRFLPIENDYSTRKFAGSFCGQKGLDIWQWAGYLRGIVTLEGDNKEKIFDWFDRFYVKLNSLHPNKPEPMLNILTYYQTGKWIIHIIPRKLHRPSQFFEEGEKQILISPASVDLGGILITPREEDFNKINENNLKDIFAQVCFTERELLGLFI